MVDIFGIAFQKPKSTFNNKKICLNKKEKYLLGKKKK